MRWDCCSEEWSYSNWQNHHSLTKKVHHIRNDSQLVVVRAEIQEQDAKATTLLMTCLSVILVQFDFHSKSREHQNKNCQLKSICLLCVSVVRIVMTQQSNIFITKDSSPIPEKDLVRKLKCLHLLQKDKKCLPSDRRDCKKRKGRFIVKAIRFQSNTLSI